MSDSLMDVDGVPARPNQDRPDGLAFASRRGFASYDDDVRASVCARAVSAGFSIVLLSFDAVKII